MNRAATSTKTTSTKPLDQDALVNCLIILRERLQLRSASDDVKLIDAVLGGDPDTALRIRIGDARLTPKQFILLRAIDRHVRSNGVAPTLDELSQDLGVAKVTIFGHIQELLAKGVIENEKNKSRSIRIIDQRERTQKWASTFGAAETRVAGLGARIAPSGVTSYRARHALTHGVAGHSGLPRS